MYRPTSSTKRPSASASRHASADWIASLPRLATRRVIDSVERCAESYDCALFHVREADVKVARDLLGRVAEQS